MKRLQQRQTAIIDATGKFIKKLIGTHLQPNFKNTFIKNKYLQISFNENKRLLEFEMKNDILKFDHFTNEKYIRIGPLKK
jgi:hypothetical protein